MKPNIKNNAKIVGTLLEFIIFMEGVCGVKYPVGCSPMMSFMEEQGLEWVVPEGADDWKEGTVKAVV